MWMFREFTRGNGDAAGQRVLFFCLLPILLGLLMFFGWEYRAVGLKLIQSGFPGSASAAALPVDPPPAAALETSSASPAASPIANPSDSAATSTTAVTPDSPATPAASGPASVPASVFDEQAKRNNEALALATQKLQAVQAELSVTRRELEQTQWDVALWKQQVATSSGERDHALQQVKDLTEQLRQNFLELNSAQASLNTLQKQNAAGKERLNELLKMQRAFQNRTPRPADN